MSFLKTQQLHRFLTHGRISWEQDDWGGISVSKVGNTNNEGHAVSYCIWDKEALSGFAELKSSLDTES